MNPQQILDFLKKHSMMANSLADMAGVGRWSLRRYLTIADTSITVKTANKLEAVMYRVEQAAKETHDGY